MDKPKPLIHLPVNVGGTLIMTIPDHQRAVYEEALRRYDGPAQFVLCREAYVPTVEERARVSQAVRTRKQVVTQYSQRLPHHCSLHLLNYRQREVLDIAPFWTILDAVEKESARGRNLPAQDVVPPGKTSPDEFSWWGYILFALVLTFGFAWLFRFLWRYYVTD